MNNYTSTEYADAMRRLDLKPYQQRMLQIHFHAPDQTLTASQMAKAMGYKNYGGANLHYGVLGKLVGELLGCNPMPSTTLYVLAEFQKPGKEWHWIMRPAVCEALCILGLVNEVASGIPEEVPYASAICEGSVKTIRVNAYERSSLAREKCILHHGCRCYVCSLILAEVYGEPAQGYIHVHHLRQLSEIGESYQVDPINDLRPVCPNCHAIIHTRQPAYSIEEVKDLIQSHKGNANQCVGTPTGVCAP
jgi:5-methylcytosine-specific restriction enzyme A